jgi:hypothetical protein
LELAKGNFSALHDSTYLARICMAHIPYATALKITLKLRKLPCLFHLLVLLSPQLHRGASFSALFSFC